MRYMAFSEEIKNAVNSYCNNHLAPDSWYENEFSFIKDAELRERIIAEFKAIRFAYKLYEGIEATDTNLMFEVRNQIFAYLEASEIDVRLGATWLAPEIIQKFMAETFQIPYYLRHAVKVRYSPYIQYCKEARSPSSRSCGR